MSNNLQQAVADLERELDDVKNDRDNAKNQLALISSEHDRLVRDLEAATAKSEGNLIRCIQMETIINQVSAGLLDGLARMKTADPAEVIAAHQAIEDQKRTEAAEAETRAALQANPPKAAAPTPSANEAAVAAALEPAALSPALQAD